MMCPFAVIALISVSNSEFSDYGGTASFYLLQLIVASRYEVFRAATKIKNDLDS